MRRSLGRCTAFHGRAGVAFASPGRSTANSIDASSIRFTPNRNPESGIFRHELFTSLRALVHLCQPSLVDPSGYWRTVIWWWSWPYRPMLARWTRRRVPPPSRFHGRRHGHIAVSCSAACGRADGRRRATGYHEERRGLRTCVGDHAGGRLQIGGSMRGHGLWVYGIKGGRSIRPERSRSWSRPRRRSPLS